MEGIFPERSSGRARPIKSSGERGSGPLGPNPRREVQVRFEARSKAWINPCSNPKVPMTISRNSSSILAGSRWAASSEEMS